jgi:hypothetical protein
LPFRFGRETGELPFRLGVAQERFNWAAPRPWAVRQRQLRADSRFSTIPCG